ncbi:SDR family oxidoreductase [Pontibacter sp. SGAir0037]|uniref:SDR family oxidoreductase n=1 Tax=Pontibacter sp. SGAir0037 TaxID=2571030 RepID=UPI00143D5E87|nr:SDR family NAD(P)-dependent oxidoreductase [Pontibacter sp. SGAir0037]
MKIDGRRALISGGGSGIGYAIAKKLTAAGARAAVADISFTGEEEHIFDKHICDVSSGPAVDTLFAEVRQSIGAPDLLVCCAGRGIQEKLTEGDPQKWSDVIDTNLLGALRMVRAFVPAMLEAGKGDVVFVSSVAAHKPHTYGGVYAATKAALEVVAETLRLEVLPSVRVTVVAPGVTDTNFFKNTISGFQTAESIGYGAVSPDEVADAVLFALSQPQGVSLNHITIRPTGQPF